MVLFKQLLKEISSHLLGDGPDGVSSVHHGDVTEFRATKRYSS
jgi:hypothetical protein